VVRASQALLEAAGELDREARIDECRAPALVGLGQDEAPAEVLAVASGITPRLA